MSVSAKGGSGSGAAFVHDQPIAVSPWTVVHNLGMFPNVTVVDATLAEIIADVTYTSLNVVTINFGMPVSGKAFLS